ncbi:DUF2958 domain-containing protein [Aliarcobacter cryaerophilus]|uniref:DUF2958 domain-containing protein n=1 Tax=Aliarcobacter cryaerophilus TaxID=28198 RepID=UPI003DA56124
MIITNFNNAIPKIYDQQRNINPKVYARYFIDNSDWEWLVLEYSKLQRLFFGLILPENKLTYFTVEELQKLELEYGVKVELDYEFKITELKEKIDERVA